MLKVLMLVNWKVEKCEQPSLDKQPPDYIAEGQPYWFYRYFQEPVQVDVLDISSIPAIERLEREKLRFYVIQALRAMSRLHRYDLIVSHGMQSGVILSLWRRLVKGKSKHIVFDIGSFNSAAESGMALKLMQFSSKSIDGLIYHTGTQKQYYEKYFPWLGNKAEFIKFGTDSLFFDIDSEAESTGDIPYIVCTGYIKRDWDTLIKAYGKFVSGLDKKDVVPELRMIGKHDYHMPENICWPERAVLKLVPYIPVRELMKQIGGAAFCVLPLEYFNYSFGQMTLLQQMALGKAVIAAKVPSMLDYVEDGRNGMLYEAGNSLDLCNKMKLLWENEELRSGLGKRASAYVKQEHNEKKMAVQIEQFYSKIMGESL